VDLLTELFNQYGYIILFAALALELIAFPTPGETLMTYCGFLVFQGKLNWGISIVAASLGIISGITVSYFIGRTVGTPFFKKYGSYIYLGPDKLDKTSQWFERYGNGLLIAAYFIPGIRHVTGYFSGITRMNYRRFALNAYIGAFIWAGTFITLGRALGENWDEFRGSISKYLIVAAVILVAALICFYIYKKYKDQIIALTINSLERSIKIFHSLGKMRAVISGLGVVFVGLSIAMIALIQDLLANELSQFDNIETYLVEIFFPDKWTSFMRIFQFSTAPEVLTVLTLLIFAWIMLRGRNRFLETSFLIITILGGELLGEGLRLIFHRLGSSGLSYTFPSEQTLMAVVAYGFVSFMLLRHARERRWLGTILAFVTFGICIFTGLSGILFQTQYPSDVVAGYVLGGVWLSLNVVLLEVYRVLAKIK